jgi:hypothetical protein
MRASIVAVLPILLLAACGQLGNGDGTGPVQTNSILAAERVATVSAAPVRTVGGHGDPLSHARPETLTEAHSKAGEIRADIETYIDGLPDTAIQKHALRQTAKAFTLVLSANPADRAALNVAAAKLSDASSCIFSRYDEFQAPKRARELERRHINTRQRQVAYHTYNSARSGSITLSPLGDGCE